MHATSNAPPHDAARALVALLADGPGEARAAVRRARPDALVDLARRNKVLFALEGAREALRARAPDCVDRLDSYALRTLAMNRGCLTACARLSRTLAEGGVGHVVFKGPVQQMALYGSPFVKASGDVDILVAEADRARAAAAVEALGYRGEDAHLASWWVRHLGERHFADPAGGPTVDLHHGLRQPGSPPTRRHDGFIAQSRLVRVEGVAVPTPSARHLCLVVALNLVKALVARAPCLGHAADLGRALERLGADERPALEASAREAGLVDTLAVARAVSARVLGRGAPDRGGDPLGFVADDVLLLMVAAPWSVAQAAPRRSRLLWALCGRAPIRFVREAGRAAASEITRRRLEAAR